MPTVKEIKEHLSTYPDDAIIAVAIWQAEDVIQKAEDMGKTVSQEDADDIIDSIHYNHDCTIGITWDTIDYYLYSDDED